MKVYKQASGCRSARFVPNWAKGVLFFCLNFALVSVSFADSARVSDVRGNVEKRAPGALQWRTVAPGERIEEGSMIRTGSNSSVEIITVTGHNFVIKSDSNLEFKSLQAGDTKTYLEKGRVLSKVRKLKELEKFSVQTPTAVCAVRGTEFDTISGDRGTLVAVHHGLVGVAIPGGANEVSVPAGQMTSVHNGTIELPRPIPQEAQKKVESPIANEARHEVGLDMDRNAVIAAAAMERRFADYVEGKSLIDVEGRRVRLDEYIVRTAANQFKFVALNERGDKLDYFYYKGTFNQSLPSDLNVALKDIQGKLGTQPDYYLTGYEMGMSNTRDNVLDLASGGHLIKIEIDNSGNYVLTDALDPSVTRTVQAAELIGADLYKVYNPLSDSFVNVSGDEANKLSKLSVYLPDSDKYQNLATGDVYWKTRYNSYDHTINDVPKYSYVPSGADNMLAVDLDATKTIAGGWFYNIPEQDPNNVDVTITRYYGDGTFEKYRTVLIDDNGTPASLDAFSAVTSGAEYKGELLKWNYEQQVSATEFEGRKIDIVVEPKIFIKSGLIN